MDAVSRHAFCSLSILGIDSASPEMRMRLNSALDENERLDNDLVGQLVREARMKSAASSPLKSQNTVEVRYLFKSAFEGNIVREFRCLLPRFLFVYLKRF